MNHIRHIRKEIFRITQYEFAMIAGCRQPTVSRWESDLETDHPSIFNLVRIREAAVARGLSWDDRLFFEDVPLANSKTCYARPVSK